MGMDHYYEPSLERVPAEDREAVAFVRNAFPNPAERRAFTDFWVSFSTQPFGSLSATTDAAVTPGMLSEVLRRHNDTIHRSFPFRLTARRLADGRYRFSITHTDEIHRSGVIDPYLRSKSRWKRGRR